VKRSLPRGLHRTVATAALGGLLALTALFLPDASPGIEQSALVKVPQATGVDLSDLGKGVVWILAVGSDARPGEDMTHSRGDALQLIGIDTATGAAADIGIPRDSWVDIPGHGMSKINASLYFGGPQLLGQTIGDLVGIQPSYVFVTRFQFFENMVNSIGGITVDNPVAFNDSFLKPKGFPTGRIHLNGYDAMAFSRSRHDLLRGDFDRSANQQRVVKGIQEKVRERASQHGFLAKGVLTVMKDLYTDLPPAQLFQLARAVASVDPSKVTNCVVQGSIGTSSDGQSIVLPYVAAAHQMADEARNDATIEHCY
jgi:LCP family protein required for cell wall assembly